MAIDDNLQSNIESSVQGTAFQLETNAHIFQMLSKNVYNNIILAPIRELSTNAVDACIAANKPIKFDVHLPSISNSTFSVRDYGTGLSPDDIYGLFSTAGASTKRDSNAYNGSFGIGRLSGLAYATSFTVESFYKGTHYSYMISIDNGIPVTIELGSVKTNEPDGLRLSLSVKPQDTNKFHSEALNLYKYFDNKPNIISGEEIPELKPSISGTNWFKSSDVSGVKLLMANVVYSVKSYEYDFPNGIVIKAPTGAVSITPGRESLNYDDKTNKYLKDICATIYKDITTEAQIDIDSRSTSIERYNAARDYVSTFYNKITPANNFDNYWSVTTNRWGSTQIAFNIPTAYKVAMYDGPGSKQITLANYYSKSVPTQFLVQNIAKDIIPSLNAFHEAADENYLILKPLTNSLRAIEELESTVYTWLDSIGATYEKLSDYLIASHKTSSDKLAAEEFYEMIPNPHNNSTYKGNKVSTNTSTPYLYVVNGDPYDTVIQPIDASYSKLSSITGKLPKLIVVPKKVLVKIQKNPNFTPAKEGLESAIASLEDIHINYRGASFTALDSVPADHVPSDLAEYRATVRKWHSKPKKLIIEQEDLNYLKKIKPDIEYTEIALTTSWSDLLDKYPLVTYHRSSDLAHYLKLEKHYHESNPSS